jgi:hypothetical protein
VSIILLFKRNLKGCDDGVYNTQNYWGFGFSPSSGILKEHDIFETGPVYRMPSLGCCATLLLYEGYREVLGQNNKNADLLYSTLTAISFQTISFGTYTAILLFFSTLQKHHRGNSLKCCRVPLVVPFGCQTLFQNVVPSVSFSVWEKKRSVKGLIPVK